ncbi:carboxymuconolactone decarboxylase family protein [Nonomuraea sp. NPDC050556]|uniref:carboxymuconolactone decarboxylase family protein n=1 Tax=Nonomuraea sp. NPDC050556 TaxID=3364369 RepID=UPI00378DAA84
MNERYDRGRALLERLGDPAAIEAAFEGVAPDLARYVIEFAFGDVYARPGLDAGRRQLVTIGVLTALGGVEAALEFHIAAALKVGVTREEVVEAITHCVPYAGFPKVVAAMRIARKALAQAQQA